MRAVLTLILSILSLFPELLAQRIPGNNSFIPPVKPPNFFAGDFGELRPNHFHSGLDFRTQGRTGLPVFAAKEGYISRIGISPTGYGNVLYMNHPDETTSVYGHLLKFEQNLQEYVKEKQYDRESFSLNITLNGNEFYFKKGDIIAFSGNSGSSGGPHLHFEIRDTKSERVYNPLLYHFGIKDNSAPKIRAIYAYPLTEYSNIGENRMKKRFEAIPVPGGYRLKNNAPIELYGKIGFGVQADDDFNGTGLKCGIYSATLYCDGREVFGFMMDSFSFEDTRYANAQSDYEEHLKIHHWIQRLYRQPGNFLDIYNPVFNNGILSLEDGKAHEFELVVSDIFKNKSSLKFKSVPKKAQLPLKRIPLTRQFLFDQPNEFQNDKIKIEVPKGALYDNLEFIWKETPQPAGCYSNLQHVNSKYIPVHKSYSLSIKCSNLPNSLKNKALIVSIDPSTGKKGAVGGAYSDGWVSVKSNLFGSFAVTVDQTPPVIRPLSIREKKILTDPSKLQFKIVDDLSGIKSYRGEIDGKWILFEYDAKSATIVYQFDKQRMVFGKSHLLRLVVTDNRDNSSEYKAIIYK